MPAATPTAPPPGIFDSLDMTLMSAPFSSRRRWLSFFKCSSCCNEEFNFHFVYYMEAIISILPGQSGSRTMQEAKWEV